MNGVAKRNSNHGSNSSVLEMQDMALHVYGKSLVSDDENWYLPFNPLPGEIHERTYSSKENFIVLTNYRLIICLSDTFLNIPIRNIEYVEIRDLLELTVYTKDGTVGRLSFDTPEASTKWWQFLTTASATPGKVNDLFAFMFHTYLKKSQSGSLSLNQNDASVFISELKRLEFDTRSIWRISEINSKFEICPSYPKFHIVPAWTSDKDLMESSKFRSIGRFPSVVWRDVKNGAVLARASQPEVGLFGWRCSEDEKLLSSVARSALLNSWTHVPIEPGKTMKPLLVIDARSYTAAFANRAKGGGFEYQEYYADCQIQFMSLTNIHGIRKSFQSLRTLCQQGQDQTNWMSSLEATKWLHYLSVLFRSATLIVNAIRNEGQSVLVHCSDGWDRTAQLVSLAKLLMDPFYRTIKGFQTLIEREWLDFGHKFGDRCGHSIERDVNERSPVFLQWLDCVHQLVKQFPTAFEFNEHLLVKLALHTYSCLYGTFLCNNARERQEIKLKQNTSQIWELFKASKNDYKNFLYIHKQRVLYPNYQIRHLVLWEKVYLPKTPKFADVVEYEEDLANLAMENNESGYLPDDHDIGLSCTKADVAAEKKDINKNGFCGEMHQNDPVDCNGHVNSEKDNVKNKVKKIFNDLANGDDICCCKGDQNGFNDKAELVSECINCNENGFLDKGNDSNEGLLSSSEKNNCTDGCGESSEMKQDDVGECCDDSLYTSTTSSTKTITFNTEGETILSDDKNKTEENSNSEPTTPKSGKFIGHRRTHSSDGSPVKNVIKTVSYSEGMTSSAYYSQEIPEQVPIKSLQNPSENVNLISKLLSIDGLIKSEDALQQRLQEINLEHSAEVRKWHRRFESERKARLHMASRREDVQSTSSSRKTSENCDDVAVLSDSASVETQSLSSISNEESWERVQMEETLATRWVPDHIVNICTECNQQFNLVVRKHHCRKCGRIFCGACANQYMPLPDEQLYEPVRVCSQCFEQHYTA
ncbi:myotubularin-related protein 3-like isoform X2 [Rhopilema esculentum]|uniref:myotubularin-related protein 3-like isoform X2 n=1 Tax=Rhopilema esculentum TaxID=499914 RepID=UPI0031D1D23D|eukprot:gene15142-6329_t